MKVKYYLFSSHLDDNEEILDVAHRHIFLLFKCSLKTFFFFVLLPILFYLFFPQAIFISLVWLGLGFLGMLYHFIDWYFDAWLITNTGVIDIERNGLFDRNSTRIEYHMIEGIAFNIKGFWQTVLNFGQITIDKIGASTTVILDDAASPKAIERKIIRYQEQFVNEKSLRDHHTLKSMLSEMIAYHIQNEKIDLPNEE
ncbi:hypothetical protein GF354_05425 [Candidatus Peregrinibacteria bacterium]|nr:hypothetical protein [Candidatus Peregrinibacteria bacterium]